MLPETHTAAAQPLNGGQRALLLIGGIGPIGRAPASGTLAVVVVGVPLAWVMSALPVWAYVGITLALGLASVAVHDIGDRLLGEKDSRRLVWDELVGFLIAMTAVPMTWPLMALGVVLERAIDISKVFPANVIERRWPGGWGVVGDDVVAGLYTLGLLHLASRLVPALSGPVG